MTLKTIEKCLESVFRSILIYNAEYKIIDKNLTDSNVGARKGRN